MKKEKAVIKLIFVFFILSILSGCGQETAINNNKEQKQDSTAVQFSFYPSGSDFIKSIIDKRGSVPITNEMRESFNLFARDYKWIYLPDMNYYESFFEANEYAQHFNHNNFGFAIFYVFQYMDCPEKINDKTMQDAIQTLFVSKDSYVDMPHQDYGKLAKYKDGCYSLNPEGGLDHDRMYYLLTGLDIVQEESGDIYITTRIKSYYFHDSGYEPGENEKWLAEKSKELGVSDMEAAEVLLANGEMEELKDGTEFETKIYIKFNGQSPESYNPRFLSNRSSSID